jgi:hypothetical protein
MAMTACWECKKEISDTAAVCPHCGAAGTAGTMLTPLAAAPAAAKKAGGSAWPWIVGLPIGLLILFLLYGGFIPEYEAAARERRNICEQLAAPYQRSECDRIYASDIARGKALQDEKRRR